MSIHYIWLNANPELQEQLREASEARAAAFYAAWKATVRVLVDPVRALVERIHHARRARATYRELSALSDHHLRDIGLFRAEIAGIADAVAASSPDVGLTLAELRQVRSAPSASRGSRREALPREDRRPRSAATEATVRSPAPSAENQRAAA